MKTAWAAMALMACSVAVATEPPRPPSYDGYLAVLRTYVDEDGLVDYAGLKADRARIDAFAASIAAFDSSIYDKLVESDQVAFWLNAYNALTLKLIVDHYPIQPATSRTSYPGNSIRQIPGAWDQKQFDVMGRKVTLDHIEHKILRTEFKEPRIHMALVCAAVSCPKLRREPYFGASIDTQLDDQAKAFLADLTKFHIDRENKEVWVSPIFEWFVDDFAPGATTSNERYVAEKKAILAFVPKYVREADRKYLETETYKVRYFEYDWTLNERTK